MNARPDSADFRQLFLSGVTLLDVRAPVEFSKGAFPTSVNIPLLDDEQRAAIGTEYKHKGQEAAIALGWRLATEAVRRQRREAWLAHIARHPQGYLYCFRGGLRSRLSQQLIREAGVDYPLVVGGYKAMRRYLIEQLERLSRTVPLILVSGRTGSGKTRLLPHLPRMLDLEALARHRGSAFGRQLQPQPSQIEFENALSIGLLRHDAQAVSPLFIEDEGKLIGYLALPECLRERMRAAPMVILETPLQERVDIALADYVTDALPQFTAAYGEDAGRQQFREQILGNLARIRKRLGGQRYTLLRDSFDSALKQFLGGGGSEAFRPGIERLLTEYYDPMYDYQRTLREGRVLFRGIKEELIDWARHYSEKST